MRWLSGVLPFLYFSSTWALSAATVIPCPCTFLIQTELQYRNQLAGGDGIEYGELRFLC